MNIFITGQKGLIGNALEKRLKKEGHKIVAGIDLKVGKNIIGLKNVESKIKIDLCIHAAAHCKINQSIKFPKITYENNVEGTFNVLEFCRRNKIPKILFFSSSRVLSKEKNPYTASKLYGEELCKAYYDSYGIKYIIIRPSTVYGPFWDKTKRLIHIFIVNALQGKDLKIFGNPKTKTLDFSYIDDFIWGVMLSIKGKWNKEHNISGEEEFKIFDLAKFIIKETRSASQIKIYKAEIAQPQEVKVSNQEIKKLGYCPQTKLKEGVIQTIAWYKAYFKKRTLLKAERIRYKRKIKILLGSVILFGLVGVGLFFLYNNYELVFYPLHHVCKSWSCD